MSEAIPNTEWDELIEQLSIDVAEAPKSGEIEFAFSFQASEFYQKCGYVIYEELPDFPAGHRRFF